MISVHRFLTPIQAQESVREGDAAFDAELRACYDDLLLSRGRFHGQSVKAIALCGPTCAGKTTTAKKLTKIFGYTILSSIIFSLHIFSFS